MVIATARQGQRETTVGTGRALPEGITQRILVTGATGFVGRHVVRILKEKGVTVRAMAHRRDHEQIIGGENVELCYSDVTDDDATKAAMEDVDGVVHLVAIIREQGTATFDRVNHHGTARLVTAAREAGVRCFVQLSAIGATNNPKFPYFHSKWRGEQAVIQSGIPYAILRGSILFGNGDEFINTLASMHKVFPVIPVAGNGQSRFQPLHVEDMAQCIAQVLDREELRAQCIEIGGPTHLTYDQIIATIGRTLELRRPRNHVPLPLMRAMVKLMGKTLPHPPATLHQLDMLAFDNIAHLDTLEQVFGFKARPLEGNIDYINQISFTDALRRFVGLMPKHIRDD